MRILLSDISPATRIRLAHLLRREPWVTAVFVAEPEQSRLKGESPDDGPWFAAEGEITAGSDLTSRVGAAHADLLVIDWDLSAPLPAGTLESLAASYPQTIVAALSTRPEERQAAMAAGVAAFVVATGPEDAVAGLRSTFAPP